MTRDEAWARYNATLRGALRRIAPDSPATLEAQVDEVAQTITWRLFGPASDGGLMQYAWERTGLDVVDEHLSWPRGIENLALRRANGRLGQRLRIAEAARAKGESVQQALERWHQDEQRRRAPRRPAAP